MSQTESKPENKYLEYTGLNPDDDLDMQAQLRLLAQYAGGDGGYLLWRSQGGAGGTYPLGHFDNEEDAEEAKEFVEAQADEYDNIGKYYIEEITEEIDEE